MIDINKLVSEIKKAYPLDGLIWENTLRSDQNNYKSQLVSTLITIEIADTLLNKIHLLTTDENKSAIVIHSSRTPQTSEKYRIVIHLAKLTTSPYQDQLKVGAPFKGMLFNDIALTQLILQIEQLPLNIGQSLNRKDKLLLVQLLNKIHPPVLTIDATKNINIWGIDTQNNIAFQTSAYAYTHIQDFDVKQPPKELLLNHFTKEASAIAFNSTMITKFTHALKEHRGKHHCTYYLSSDDPFLYDLLFAVKHFAEINKPGNRIIQKMTATTLNNKLPNEIGKYIGSFFGVKEYGRLKSVCKTIKNASLETQEEPAANLKKMI